MSQSRPDLFYLESRFKRRCLQPLADAAAFKCDYKRWYFSINLSFVENFAAINWVFKMSIFAIKVIKKHMRNFEYDSVFFLSFIAFVCIF